MYCAPLAVSTPEVRRLSYLLQIRVATSLCDVWRSKTRPHRYDDAAVTVPIDRPGGVSKHADPRGTFSPSTASSLNLLRHRGRPHFPLYFTLAHSAQQPALAHNLVRIKVFAHTVLRRPRMSGWGLVAYPFEPKAELPWIPGKARAITVSHPTNLTFGTSFAPCTYLA